MIESSRSARAFGCWLAVFSCFAVIQLGHNKPTGASCGTPAIQPDLFPGQSLPRITERLLSKLANSTYNGAPRHPASPFVIGGTTAVPHSFPWMAAVMTGEQLTCGGTLLNENWVLTAAHCVASPTIKTGTISIKLGVDDVEKEDENSDQKFQIGNTVIHDGFDPATYVNDLALIKLDHPASLNTYVSPICLPPSPSLPTPDTLGTVTGWGYISEFGPNSNLLQQVQVPALSRAACVADHSPDTISETMFCAGYPDGGKDACHADSGGPFQVKSETTGLWTQLGIVDWGKGCAEPNSPGVYTGVGPFVEWIKGIIGEGK